MLLAALCKLLVTTTRSCMACSVLPCLSVVLLLRPLLALLALIIIVVSASLFLEMRDCCDLFISLIARRLGLGPP